jgi:IS1 family transposase
LKSWKILLYCTDDYQPYESALPIGRHYIGKDQRAGSVCLNSRLAAAKWISTMVMPQPGLAAAQ